MSAKKSPKIFNQKPNAGTSQVDPRDLADLHLEDTLPGPTDGLCLENPKRLVFCSEIFMDFH